MTAADPLSETIPYNLFREPLEYLFADHVRQQSICVVIYELMSALETEASSAPLPNDTCDKIKRVVHYLEMELPLHIADEEMDILPSLRARALPEDHLDDVMTQLGREHEQDEKLADQLSKLLEATLKGTILPKGTHFSDIAGRFAEAHCKHMKWENECLLPLARRRLTPEDKKRIGRAMAARRQVTFPD